MKRNASAHQQARVIDRLLSAAVTLNAATSEAQAHLSGRLTDEDTELSPEPKTAKRSPELRAADLALVLSNGAFAAACQLRAHQKARIEVRNATLHLETQHQPIEVNVTGTVLGPGAERGFVRLCLDEIEACDRRRHTNPIASPGESIEVAPDVLGEVYLLGSIMGVL